MPRFAGFISLGTPQFDANDLMSRMAGAYGITNGGLVQDVATDSDGAPVFGLVVTDPNCTTAQLEQRWDRRPGQWHVIDGRVDSIDGSPVEETNYRQLADLWRDDPTGFYRRVSGGLAGVHFDAEQRRMTLFRDRFGVRTWYYATVGGMFVFASEIKALLACPQLVSQVNYNMLSRYLAMNYRMWYGRGETFFADILEQPVSTCLNASQEGVLIERYWSPPDYVLPSCVPGATYVETCRDLLEQSVSHCLQRSRRPLFFVSGGLDAPVVAALARKISGESLDCCAGVFPEHSDLDESPYIQALTDEIASDVYLCSMTPSMFLDIFDEILERHDQPLLAPNYALSFHLLRRAKEQGYDAVFGGGGGDIYSQGCLEYQPYLLADYRQYGEQVYQQQLQHWCDRVGPYLRYWPGEIGSLHEKITELVDWQVPGVIRNNPDWVRPDRTYLGSEQEEWEPVPPHIGFQFSTYRQSRLAEELHHQAIPTHFVEDINSAMFGLNGFDPMWDLPLLEFGLTLPLTSLTHDGWTKRIVRDLTAGILPDKLRLRPDKTGLAMPIGAWLRDGPVADACHESLQSDVIRKSGLFNVEAIDHALSAHQSNGPDHSGVLWKLFAYVKWAERWL